MYELHKFGEAIEALRAGKTVKRQIWDGAKLAYVPESGNSLESIAVTLWNGRRVIGWNPTIEDLFSADWIIQ